MSANLSHLPHEDWCDLGSTHADCCPSKAEWGCSCITREVVEAMSARKPFMPVQNAIEEAILARGVDPPEDLNDIIYAATEAVQPFLADIPSPATSTEGQVGSGDTALDVLRELLAGADDYRCWYVPGEIRTRAEALLAAQPAAPEPSTAEVLAGLREEMTKLRTELYDSGRDDDFYEAIGAGKARNLVEAAQQRLADRGRGGGSGG